MRASILTNALDFGDAVSTHCIVLKEILQSLGIPTTLYAEFSENSVRHHVTPVDQLLKDARPDDVLIHQLFNATSLIPIVERFPGRRILIYLDVTPPEFMEGSPDHQSCLRGLRLARSVSGLYDLAMGISEFSRLSLESMGYSRTGVFPPLMDLDRLEAERPDPVLMNEAKWPGTSFLFVGRVAPNKGIHKLIEFLARYRDEGKPARLVLVGNDQQHPAYTERLLRQVQALGLRAGEDVVFTGKVPQSSLVAYYRRADAFLCLSEHEGFCTPLIESMAFGIPVFSTAAGACEQTMGGAGVLLRETGPDALARTVSGVLADPSEVERVLASQARRLADFRPEQQRRRVADLVRIAGERPGRTDASRRPPVSVVINTYNRAWYLDRCLEALRSQTYREFEVVVVNGPSTDGTGEVLMRHEAHIRVAHTTSRVLSVSRNEGIAAARGDLIAFIDDDAIPHPGWLENLVPPFQESKVGGAGGTVYRINGKDIEFRNGLIDRLGFVRWDEPEPGTHFDWEDGYLNTVSGNNCIFRRRALEQIGGFDEQIEYYHDEADVVQRMQLASYRTVHRPDARVYHEAAASRNRRTSLDLNWFAIVKNTLYCALKNYSGGRARPSIAWGITHRIIHSRMLTMMRWLRCGEVGWHDFFRMEWSCVRGILAGVRKGLRPSPRTRDLSRPACEEAFNTYCREGVSHLAVCLLSQGLPPRAPGGVATYTLTLARALHDAGCTVHVVSCGNSSPLELREGIWYHTIAPVNVAGDLMMPPECAATARTIDYCEAIRRKILDIDSRWGIDVVESPSWDAEGLLAAMDQRFPVVVRLVTPLFKVMETQRWPATDDLQLCCGLEELLLRYAAGVIGSTQSILNTVGERYPLDGSPTAVVPFGIQLAPGNGANPTVRQVRILFVGRLERRKGIHTLLAAIPLVLSQCRPDVHFDLVGKDLGDGSSEINSWRQHWDHHHSDWSGRVHFHGEVDDAVLSQFYQDCSILVAPSLYESFGLIFLEAMARGKPTIGTSTGGIPEVVSHGETGVLIPPDDPPALAKAVLQLLAQPERARRMGLEGQRRFRELHSPEVFAQRTLEIYRDAIERWNNGGAVVWRGNALDCRRDPSDRVVWMPELQRPFALAELGPARTIVYGPYVRLPAGVYRAEFKLWIGAGAGGLTVATLDVVNIKRGFRVERTVHGSTFSHGSGAVVDVFFTIPGDELDDLELRVHTTGSVPIYFSEIRVSRWPRKTAATGGPSSAWTAAQMYPPVAVSARS